jgi:Zn-dependent peptidase ImmA (M78 family)
MRGLPKSINLFVTEVHVKLMTKVQMREEAECEDDHTTPEGLYDGDVETIYIGRWLRRKRRREILMHELAHACLDWRDEGKCEGD